MTNLTFTTDHAIDTTISPELYSKQVDIEKNMTQSGVDRYEARVVKALAGQTEASTKYGVNMVKTLVPVVTKAIVAFIEKAQSGAAGRRHASVKYLTLLDPAVSALIALQFVVNGISKERPLSHVMLAIGQQIEDEVRYQGIRAEDEKLYKSLEKAAAKRHSAHNKRTLVMHVARKQGIDFDVWPKDDRLHVGSKLIDLIMEATGIVTIEARAKPGTGKTTNVLVPSEEALSWISKRREFDGLLTPVYTPMVVPPLDWTDVYTGGYLTRYVRPLRMIKARIKGSLDEINQADMPMVYAALNHIQATAWRVNGPLLDIMAEVYRSGGTWAGIPDGRDMELPLKPADIDTNDQARKDWRAKAAAVYEVNTHSRSARSTFNTIRFMAEDMREYDRIYMPYTLDFRGRIYAVPMLNPQGADYTKALLQFGEAKQLGENGYRWLLIHGANLAGVDKVTFEERSAFIQAHMDEVLAIAKDPISNRQWVDGFAKGCVYEKNPGDGIDIDKPWQFLAWCLEMAELNAWVEQGNAVEDFESRTPIALDGSCSGIQHYSMALKDPVGGRAVNIVPGEKPSDIYQMVADVVVASLREAAQEDAGASRGEGAGSTLPEGGDAGSQKLSEAELARLWLDFGVTRKVCKRPVMTFPYGSGRFGYKQQTLDDILKPAKAKMGDAFPFPDDGYQAANYLAKQIEAALPQVVTKAAEGMAFLRMVAKEVSKANLPIRWTTPLGFPVIQAKYDKKGGTRKVKTYLGGVRVMMNIDDTQDEDARGRAVTKLDPVAQANAVAPNFIHSLDAAHLQLTVVRGMEQGIDSFALIHDSFGTHAGDTDKLFALVRETMIELYSTEDVFGRFLDEQIGQLDTDPGLALALKVNEKPLIPGDMDISCLNDSRYAFA
jgi:DNA-directed RNA polymerase